MDVKLYKENKEEINYIASAGLNWLVGWLIERYKAKKQIQQAQTLCGACKLQTCLLLGKNCTLQDIKDCYEKQQPNEFGAIDATLPAPESPQK